METLPKEQLISNTMNKGRRFPAEWEKQRGVLLCFPHNGNDWPGKYQAIQWAFIEFIKKITQYESVFLIVKDDSQQNKVGGMLAKANVNLAKVIFIQKKTNRSWMRDAGPIIVETAEGGKEAINFNFNGWAKYANHLLDKHVPEAVANTLEIPMTVAKYKGNPVVLEGGAIDVNGKGSLLTTEECLLDPITQVRNPGFTKSDYETVFAEYLGITNVIWLGNGIQGDDTHGHIDDLCRFVNADSIVTVVETNKKDANFKPLQDNLKILQNATLENGKSPNIIELPMPQKLIFENIRIPASYANFLIINGAVLVPTFNDANDRLALNTLANCFPDKEIIGIGAIDLIWGFGTLHCLSQQIY
ncbi:agmatine deiminase family protein [uncultured Cyclobacterium sp.]|uniref:agmatine deiminase family protein n=1 Tax=uncultured Cyclobacterium sp. TaxID=453820 RepID=UPI0030ECF785